MSFVKKLAQERNLNIYFLNSKEGLKFYAYILVPFAKSVEFESAVKSGVYNINDYGSVIDFFIGESEPSDELKLDVQKFLETYEAK